MTNMHIHDKNTGKHSTLSPSMRVYIFIQKLITVSIWLHQLGGHVVFWRTQTHFVFRGRFCSWSQEWRGKYILSQTSRWSRTPGNSTAAARSMWVKNKHVDQYRCFSSFLQVKHDTHSFYHDSGGCAGCVNLFGSKISFICWMLYKDPNSFNLSTQNQEESWFFKLH